MTKAKAIEKSLNDREEMVQAHQEPETRLLWEKEGPTRWAKIDHLLYLPVLGLTRPHDLYYYQEQGLQVLYGFTYKYLTVEHFLGRLTRLKVGQVLAAALAYSYAQAWYAPPEKLYIFVDRHSKPPLEQTASPVRACDDVETDNARHQAVNAQWARGTSVRGLE